MKLTKFDILTCKYSIMLNRKWGVIKGDKDNWMSERFFYVLKKLSKKYDKMVKDNKE